MRILTSLLGVPGALAAAYLGLYVRLIASESAMAAPGDILLLSAPLLALAGSIAIWLRPAIARAALWAALIAWLVFGGTVAGLGAAEGQHLIDIGAIMILPTAMLAGAAYAAGKLCRQLVSAEPLR